jgi:hypothetical protein
MGCSEDSAGVVYCWLHDSLQPAAYASGWMVSFRQLVPRRNKLCQRLDDIHFFHRFPF